MADQPVEVRPPIQEQVEQVDIFAEYYPYRHVKEEARIRIKQEKDRADILESQIDRLQNEIFSTRRLEAIDLAIRLNPPLTDLISLAEQIYQFLTKDLTGNKI